MLSPAVLLAVVLPLAAAAQLVGTAPSGSHGAPATAVLAVAVASAAGASIALSRRRKSSAAEASVVVVDSLLDDRDQAILELLRSRGPLGVSEVARSLGISKSTASRKLRKLTDMGLAERIVVDGSPRYCARDAADRGDAPVSR